jgi:hypothetical protein
MNAVVDNDILLKAVCYGLVDEILCPSCGSIDFVGVLGAARFVVSRRLASMALNGSTADAAARLTALLGRAVALEPTEEEQLLAADFELAAQRASLGFDTGESQLCAVVIARATPLLLTGDKRAIRSLEILVDVDGRLLALCQKVKCLEQLVLIALPGAGGRLRAAICAEAGLDKALSICFSCRGDGDAATFAEGLQSYVNDLRSVAGRVLGP